MTTKISIHQDGIWAGTGDFRNDCVENCSAQFCDDNDESMQVYEAIEEAIANGDKEVEFTFGDGATKTYTWDLITESATIPDGLYFLHPEGSGWIAVEFDSGEIIDRTEEASEDTHRAAGDGWDGVAPNKADTEVSHDIALAIIVAAMDDDTDPAMVMVFSRQ